MINQIEVDKAITDLLNLSLSPAAVNVVCRLVNALDSSKVPDIIGVTPSPGYLLVEHIDSDIILWTSKGSKATHGRVLRKDPSTECDAQIGDHIIHDNNYGCIEVGKGTFRIVHVDDIYGVVPS